VKTGLALALIVAAGALLATAWQPSVVVPPGFSRSSAEAHAVLERRFLDMPSAERIRAAHQFLSSAPHIAGSPRDRQLAEWTRDRFQEFGFDEVEIVEHDVLLPWPLDVRIEMIAPAREPDGWAASIAEDALLQIDATAGSPVLPYHAYSASGDVTAPVVYAGDGTPADYDWLAARGVEVKGRIVLVKHSVPYAYRGFKVLTAQQRGAVGVLIYSDPIDDGHGRGGVYPDGPWGPGDRVQRGGIAYDFLVPGDPLTPGWASTPGAKRIDSRQADSLPRIVSAPLAERDARAILESLEGLEVPDRWRGALPVAYRAGPGPAVVRMRVRNDDRVRPVWTVTGMIRGRERPDDLVIVGNHRDAWVYGGVDPSSGSAAMMELARALGDLKKTGWRPRRSVLFASWDAEEFSLTSSTEWGEQHAQRLRDHAVAYVNVDSAVSGQDLAAAAVPSLNALIESAARVVRDPATRLTLAARARTASASSADTPSTLVDNRLGGGSDYAVFLNHLGVPVADLSFRGPYGVYHSAYDTHHWVATIGDPGFRYHAALVELWGLITLRLADADFVPLDYAAYANRIDEFARELRTRWTSTQLSTPDDPLADVLAAAGELGRAAGAFNARRDRALRDQERVAIGALNDQLLAVERALLDPDGIPGRPWFRHLIYAPKFTYAPEMLPGVAEAVDAGDLRRARQQAQHLAAAIRRAAAALDGSAH
jgi:N-acetylated-alpha-linked acidic dipeptidase